MKTILLIEDSEQNLPLTRFILERHGYQVIAAPDGPAGIAAALRHLPHLILLDIPLPGMDGYQVASGLRSHPELHTTPIVAVTSHAMAGDRERVLAAGCTGYLEKPINPDTFVSDVEAFLRTPIPAPPSRPVHALVVDDIKSNRELLRALLSAHGWEVSTAANGQDALAAARTQPPDIIISDILMPGLDGFSLCREWRADRQLAPIPFAFYTATYTDPKDERFGLNLGADAFLVKPLEPEALMHRLRALLAARTQPQGVANPASAPAPDDATVLREYNAALVRKLEDKMLETEALNRELEERVQRRTRELEAANLALQAFGHMGTWTSDLDPGGHLTWAPETCRIFGLTPEQFDHSLETFFRLVHPDDLESVRRASRDARAGARRLHIQHRIVRPDGQVRWIHQEAEIVHDPVTRSRKLAGIARDITDYRLLEEQLRQSQKMEAIGQLAGGVAHDFNNLLTVIRGHASYLCSCPHLDGPTMDSAREISSAAERASNLTRQLLAFSRRQSPVLRPLDLHHVVGQMTRMLRTLVGENYTLEESHGAGLPPVLADASMLEQVLLNLVVNARDAMPCGGRITLATASLHLDATEAARIGSSSPGTHVTLSVRDSGSGIDPRHLPRLFEPFFTTKADGRGTGLGLAVVYGVVQQHGGHITVTSQPHHGTTFTIYLPACAETPSHEPTPPAAPGPAHPATPPTAGTPPPPRTLLVVEDEPAVLQFVRSVLSRHGIRVHEATDAARALELWPGIRDEVDLVLSDLVMPGPLTGRELADRLQADRPGLRVVLTSGYSPESIDVEALHRRNIEFLQKPYHIDALLRLVGRSLTPGA